MATPLRLLRTVARADMRRAPGTMGERGYQRRAVRDVGHWQSNLARSASFTLTLIPDDPCVEDRNLSGGCLNNMDPPNSFRVADHLASVTDNKAQDYTRQSESGVLILRI
jgi:hypothetical protein